jgi:hypothetical protein
VLNFIIIERPAFVVFGHFLPLFSLYKQLLTTSDTIQIKTPHLLTIIVKSTP